MYALKYILRYIILYYLTLFINLISLNFFFLLNLKRCVTENRRENGKCVHDNPPFPYYQNPETQNKNLISIYNSRINLYYLTELKLTSTFKTSVPSSLSENSTSTAQSISSGKD